MTTIGMVAIVTATCQRRSAIEAYQIKANVNDNKFWASCDSHHHMLEEVLKAMRVFDGAEPTMGKA